MRTAFPMVLGLLALVPRGASACPAAEPNGTTRYLTQSYAVGIAHGAGGALGDGVHADAIRYSETNGALMDLMFGAPIRLVTDTRKRIDCNAGACTFLDVTLWTPRFNRFGGGMYTAGVSFPFAHGQQEGPAIFQLGVAIGFFDDGATRHARDALVLAVAVPIMSRLHARMRADLNIYGAMPKSVMPQFKKNSPMSAGLTADLGSVLQLTADIERYDFLRGGLGWFVGAAAKF